MADRWELARQQHRSQQADAIAASALTLLLEQGAPALTMATIASTAGVSRQTLYRYYPDVGAVLTGVAELITAHEVALAEAVADEPDPAAQLDLLAMAVAAARGHDDHAPPGLRGALPPEAREVLSNHEQRIVELTASVLEAGIEEGRFRDELRPDVDAPLLLGLAAAAGTERADRALALIHQLVDAPSEEDTP